MLSGYGTGAIMAVPAHDERDFAFAQRFGLPITRVIAAPEDADDAPLPAAYVSKATTDRLVNSGAYTGLPQPEGFARIVADLAAAGPGLADGHLSHPRLAGQPTASLGHAHPGRLLRGHAVVRHRAHPRGPAAGAAAG